jgi:manganese transport protein
MGEHSVGRLLVLSQAVLRPQLFFAIYPLMRLTGDRRLMGSFASSPLLAASAWALFLAITAASLWLLLQAFGPA